MWTIKFKKNRLFKKLCCLVEYEENKSFTMFAYFIFNMLSPMLCPQCPPVFRVGNLNTVLLLWDFFAKKSPILRCLMVWWNLTRGKNV